MRVSLTSTRISDLGVAVRNRAARGEVETRGPDSCAWPGSGQHAIAMETSALENQRARIYDSPEPCDYTSAPRGTKDGGKKLSTRALTGLFRVLERRLQQ